MIQPVDLEDFFVAFFSAAMVLVSGALYALLFAYAKVHSRPGLLPYAYGAYALLVGAVVMLARAMHWSGMWSMVAALMIVGYLLAPHVIYRLSVATHGPGHGPAGAGGGPRPG
jgi:hypothetical protein